MKKIYPYVHKICVFADYLKKLITFFHKLIESKISLKSAPQSIK